MNRLALLGIIFALMGVTSCGSTPVSTAVTCTTSTSTSSASTSSSTCTDPVTNITLSISPSTISVNVTAPQQFFGTLSGGTNNIIIWKVNNVQGGNDTVGRIDSNGGYHAPPAVPSPNPVTVTATSFEDQNLTATANVTITPAPVLTITSPAQPIQVISGSSAANSVTFNASESGGQPTDTIFWCVGPVGGNASLGGGIPNLGLGTINSNGMYTPPLTPPIGSKVIVTAAISNDCQSSAVSVPVLISGYSTSSFGGQFAFSVAGTNSSGRFFRAGSFEADGAGKLNNVMETVNEASTVTSGTFGGTYTVTSDGRGTLQFNDGLEPASFNFVLVDGTHLQIIGFDATGTASGQATGQDLSKINGDPLSALTGTYVFDFSGTHGANALSQVGEFSVSVNHAITGGAIDINDGGTQNGGSQAPYLIAGNQLPCNQTPSTYSVGSTGIGILTLVLVDSNCNQVATLNYTFYVISKGGAKFVETDTTQAVAGATIEQQLTANNGTFDKTFLNGDYAFLLANSLETYASAGSFSANGQGMITGGVLDENTNGTPNPNVMLPSGAYQIASNGRGVIPAIGGRSYVFYLGPVGTAVFQETDAGHVSDGRFALQQNASFAPSQIAGTYAAHSSGQSGANAEVITGNFTTSAATPGVITSGTLDENAGGSTHSGVAVTSGSYATSSTAERGTLSLVLGAPLSQTRNYAVYVVSPTQAFVLEMDTGFLGAGEILRQF